MIGCDGQRDVLQHHRLARLRRRHDQAALALADRRDQVDDACRQILGAAVTLLQFQALVREQRSQVLEQYLAAGGLRCVMVDLGDLQQREVSLALLRRSNQARDTVAGAQIETPDLTRRHIDVVRPGEIRTIGRTQKPETILEDLEDAIADDILAELRVLLEHREDDVLFARPPHVLDAHGLGKRHELRDRFILELVQAQQVLAFLELCLVDDLVRRERGVVFMLRSRAASLLLGLTSPSLAAIRTLRAAAC